MDWSGRPARFARYTSRTLYPGVRTKKKDQRRLKPIKKFYIRLQELADEGHENAVQLIEALKEDGNGLQSPNFAPGTARMESTGRTRRTNFSDASRWKKMLSSSRGMRCSRRRRTYLSRTTPCWST